MYTTLGLDKKKYIIEHIMKLAQFTRKVKQENMWKNYKVTKNK